MSELQLSLVALGAVTVAGIWGYNAWQARRHRKLAEDLVRRPSGEPKAADPLEDDIPDLPPAYERPPAEPPQQRLEPTLGELPPRTAEAVAPPPVDRDDKPMAAAPPADAATPLLEPGTETPRGPVAAAAESAPDETLSEPVAEAGDPYPLPPWLLSPSVDYIAAFETMEPIYGDQILQAQSENLRGIGKRVAAVGFDESQPAWEFCRDGVGYRRLRLGVQLADRHGPLGEAAFDVFYRAMQRFGDEITAVVDLPPRRQAIEQALHLDRICAGVDIQVGVNVIARSAPFAGTKIRALAESAGMLIEADGSYVRRDDDGRLQYTLHLHDGGGFSTEGMRTLAAQGLTFLLDVPRVAHGDRVFNQMVDLARRFADTLQGQLVDDNRRPITEQFLGPVRKQIAQYQATMAAQGLPAGSDVTQRLFA